MHSSVAEEQRNVSRLPVCLHCYRGMLFISCRFIDTSLYRSRPRTTPEKRNGRRRVVAPHHPAANKSVALHLPRFRVKRPRRLANSRRHRSDNPRQRGSRPATVTRRPTSPEARHSSSTHSDSVRPRMGTGMAVRERYSTSSLEEALAGREAGITTAAMVSSRATALKDAASKEATSLALEQVQAQVQAHQEGPTNTFPGVGRTNSIDGLQLKSSPVRSAVAPYVRLP